MVLPCRGERQERVLRLWRRYQVLRSVGPTSRALALWYRLVRKTFLTWPENAFAGSPDFPRSQGHDDALFTSCCHMSLGISPSSTRNGSIARHRESRNSSTSMLILWPDGAFKLRASASPHTCSSSSNRNTNVSCQLQLNTEGLSHYSTRTRNPSSP